MKVLGIDPGYDRLGIALVTKEQNLDQVIFSTCHLTDPSLPFTDRILNLGNAVEDILIKYKPDAVAIENLFFNKNTKTAIGVAQARGVILYLAKKAGCRVYEYGPQEIKIALTGYGKSDKQAVFSMIERLVKNVPQNALDDEYDAIAVGVTCLAEYRQGR